MNDKSISLFLLLLSLISLSYSHDNPVVVFVDVESKCTSCCGLYNKPFSNIKDAIEFVNRNDYDGWDLFDYLHYYRYQSFSNDIPTIIVNPGVYTGDKNKNLYIDFPVNIQSIGGSTKTIIDCETFGNGLSVSGSSSFYLNGFTIKQCHANFGGAINITNSLSNLVDVTFRDNFASLGGALSVSMKSTILSSCNFYNNKALESGGAIYSEAAIIKIVSSEFICNSNISKYDILSSLSSSITIDSESKVANIGVSCKTSGQLTYNLQDKCNVLGSCPSTVVVPENPGTQNPESPNPGSSKVYTCVKDGFCDLLTENCLSCPEDCDQCKFEGWKLESYAGLISLDGNQTLPSIVQQVQEPSVVNFMPNSDCPVSGILSSYVKVPTSNIYQVRVRAFNVGVRLLLNRLVVIDQFFQQDYIRSERSVRISGDHANKMELLFFSIASNERNVTLEWKLNPSDEWTPIAGFYSMNVCNDGIYDLSESNKTSPYYCPIDSKTLNSNAIDVCGDGVCTETPEECIMDCYDLISPKCNGQAPPSPLHFPATDTIGRLLDNQYLFTLPGLHSLRHGVDLKTGEPRPSSVFAMDYCDNSSFSIVQDFYRGLVYTVPPELFATISPQCNFEAQSTMSSTSSGFSEEFSQKTGLSTEASAGGGVSFISAAVSVAFSKEESVKRAKEFETASSGTLIRTEIQCTASKVHFSSYKFSQSFLKDISRAITVDHFRNLIKKYGSLYYKSATLGGSLVQVTYTNNTSGSESGSNSVEKKAEMSMSLSVSSPVFNVGGGASQSTDSKISEEEQQAYEKSSKRTNILVKGGNPGVFSPGEDSGDFQDYAEGIDLLPVPVDYKLGFISDIIPRTWKIQNQPLLSVRDMWIQAEDSLINEDIQNNPDITEKFNISRGRTILKVEFRPQTSQKTPITLKYTKVVDGQVVPATSVLNLSSDLTYDFEPVNEIEGVVIAGSNDQLTMSIRDVSVQRIYNFQRQGANMINRFSSFDYLIYFDISSNQQMDYTHYLELSFEGESGDFRYVARSTEVTNYYGFQIPSTVYIGNLLNLKLVYWGTGSNNFQINAVRITQSCGAPVNGVDTSGCTPDTVQDYQNIGFNHYYENLTPRTMQPYIPIYIKLQKR
ncbi:hypothetical protein DLAC_11229 [Tieghemostelium lacteum]|uniref:MACPF domain-containing protein n=1 Tax=Tieghemostelium lacteum TaxID=361077 RepID=A0A151Z3I5_TIELA|nr:hypothetical protein DLAC_11229 [Tieghemostelium lacteum]|eukprot:KYQ88511.1 hypothetical protein DLAC_11229 [Tieghemostelium lacteum]